MDIEQILMRPITTPEYPDPEEARRFINDEHGFYGYDYVFLEDATWNALCQIARDHGCTVDELCSDIDLNFAHGDAPFAFAARAYVLHCIAEHTPGDGELPIVLRDYLGGFAAAGRTAQ
jgi:predicted DNA-binding ribbon-helix-helix protein